MQLVTFVIKTLHLNFLIDLSVTLRFMLNINIKGHKVYLYLNIYHISYIFILRYIRFMLDINIKGHKVYLYLNIYHIS